MKMMLEVSRLLSSSRPLDLLSLSFYFTATFSYNNITRRILFKFYRYNLSQERDAEDPGDLVQQHIVYRGTDQQGLLALLLLSAVVDIKVRGLASGQRLTDHTGL